MQLVSQSNLRNTVTRMCFFKATTLPHFLFVQEIPQGEGMVQGTATATPSSAWGLRHLQSHGISPSCHAVSAATLAALSCFKYYLRVQMQEQKSPRWLRRVSYLFYSLSLNLFSSLHPSL